MSVAAQFKRLSGPAPDAAQLAVRAPSSFMFDERGAQNLPDRAAVFALGRSGLAEMVRLDSRFNRFLPSLFNEATMEVQRELLPVKDQVPLNKEIESCLRLLSPHLLLNDAHKMVEYLVRFFNVHKENVQAVLMAFLPYHAHRIFPRMLKLLKKDEMRQFEFLKKSKDIAVIMNRAVLVKEAMDKPQILSAIGEWARIGLKEEIGFSGWLTLYTAVTADVITQLSSSQMRLGHSARAILEHALAFLVLPNAPQDFRAGGAMIVVGLCNNLYLEQDKLKTVFTALNLALKEAMNSVGGVASSSTGQDWGQVKSVLRILACVCKSQKPSPASLSGALLTQLRQTQIVALLREMSSLYGMDDLMSTLLNAHRLPPTEAAAEDLPALLAGLVKELPLSQRVAKDLALNCLKDLTPTDVHFASHPLTPTLKAIERYYPSALDAAAAAILRDATDAALGNRVTSILAETVGCQRHSHLLATTHTVPAVRRTAMSGLDSLAAPAASEKDLRFAREAVQHALAFEHDPEVLRAVFGLDNLDRLLDPLVPYRSLLPWSLLSSSQGSDVGVFKGAAGVLERLAGEVFGGLKGVVEATKDDGSADAGKVNRQVVQLVTQNLAKKGSDKKSKDKKGSSEEEGMGSHALNWIVERLGEAVAVARPEAPRRTQVGLVFALAVLEAWVAQGVKDKENFALTSNAVWQVLSISQKTFTEYIRAGNKARMWKAEDVEWEGAGNVLGNVGVEDPIRLVVQAFAQLWGGLAKAIRGHGLVSETAIQQRYGALNPRQRQSTPRTTGSGTKAADLAEAEKRVRMVEQLYLHSCTLRDAGFKNATKQVQEALWETLAGWKFAFLSSVWAHPMTGTLAPEVAVAAMQDLAGLCKSSAAATDVADLAPAVLLGAASEHSNVRSAALQVADVALQTGGAAVGQAPRAGWIALQRLQHEQELIRASPDNIQHTLNSILAKDATIWSELLCAAVRLAEDGTHHAVGVGLLGAFKSSLHNPASAAEAFAVLQESLDRTSKLAATAGAGGSAELAYGQGASLTFLLQALWSLPAASEKSSSHSDVNESGLKVLCACLTSPLRVRYPADAAPALGLRNATIGPLTSTSTAVFALSVVAGGPSLLSALDGQPQQQDRLCEALGRAVGEKAGVGGPAAQVATSDTLHMVVVGRLMHHIGKKAEIENNATASLVHALLILLAAAHRPENAINLPRSAIARAAIVLKAVLGYGKAQVKTWKKTTKEAQLGAATGSSGLPAEVIETAQRLRVACVTVEHLVIGGVFQQPKATGHLSEAVDFALDVLALRNAPSDVRSPAQRLLERCMQYSNRAQLLSAVWHVIARAEEGSADKSATTMRAVHAMLAEATTDVQLLTLAFLIVAVQPEDAQDGGEATAMETDGEGDAADAEFNAVVKSIRVRTPNMATSLVLRVIDFVGAHLLHDALREQPEAASEDRTRGLGELFVGAMSLFEWAETLDENAADEEDDSTNETANAVRAAVERLLVGLTPQLTDELFVAGVSMLLNHNALAVRHQAVSLLSQRLRHSRPSQAALYLSALPSLEASLRQSLERYTKGGSVHATQYTDQLTLVGTVLVFARAFARAHSHSFDHLIPVVTDLFAGHVETLQAAVGSTNSSGEPVGKKPRKGTEGESKSSSAKSRIRVATLVGVSAECLAMLYTGAAAPQVQPPRKHGEKKQRRPQSSSQAAMELEHAIPCMPRIVPALLRLLNIAVKSGTAGDEHGIPLTVEVQLFDALHRIVSALPTLISAYVVDLLSVCTHRGVLPEAGTLSHRASGSAGAGALVTERRTHAQAILRIVGQLDLRVLLQPVYTFLKTRSVSEYSHAAPLQMITEACVEQAFERQVLPTVRVTDFQTFLQDYLPVLEAALGDASGNPRLATPQPYHVAFYAYFGEIAKQTTVKTFGNVLQTTRGWAQINTSSGKVVLIYNLLASLANQLQALYEPFFFDTISDLINTLRRGADHSDASTLAPLRYAATALEFTVDARWEKESFADLCTALVAQFGNEALMDEGPVAAEAPTKRGSSRQSGAASEQAPASEGERLVAEALVLLCRSMRMPQFLMVVQQQVLSCLTPCDSVQSKRATCAALRTLCRLYGELGREFMSSCLEMLVNDWHNFVSSEQDEDALKLAHNLKNDVEAVVGKIPEW